MAANIMASTSALPQVLASGQLPSTEAAVYTAPALSSVKIANASACNVSGATVTFSLGLVKAGGTLGDGTHRVVHNYSLAAGDTLPLKDLLAGHVMGPGDIISGIASSATAVDFVVSGTVFS